MKLKFPPKADQPLAEKIIKLFIVAFYLFRHPKKFWNALSGKTKMRSAGIFFAFIIIAIGTIWLTSKKIEAAWWNDLWQYRKPITVTNSSGANLTDFQVKILDNKDLSADITAGKIQASLGDLRFTDINGNILPYWIEDNTAASVDAWIKVPTVHATGTTVYMYYGNPQATSLADGNKVFEFFDDFSGSSIDSSKWTTKGTVDVSLGEARIQGAAALLYSASQLGNQWVGGYRIKLKDDGAVQDWAGVRWFNHSSYGSSYASNWWFYGSQSRYWYNLTNDGYSSIGGFSYSLDYTYHNIKVVVNDKTHSLYDGASLMNTSDLTGQSCSSTCQFGFAFGRWLSNASYYYVDYAFTRKYASADPSAGTPATEEKATSPVAYWSFDEGYGNTSYDSTVNKNDGSITGATWKPESECVSGKCLGFDGNDYIQNPTATTLRMQNNSFTAEAWIKGTTFSAAGDSAVFGTDATGTNLGLHLVIRSKIPYMGFYGNDSWGNTTLNDNQWYHIVWRFDSTNGEQAIFINGKLDASSTGHANFQGTDNIKIGRWAGGYFNGFIDEPKIYPFARTAAQIKNDYTSGMAGMGKAKEGVGAAIGDKSDKWMTDGLVGWWKMDESSWGSVIDSSGNGNTGTVAGGATVAAGKFGNGGSFDGSDDYVGVGISAFPTGSNPRTMSLWFKMIKSGAQQALFNYGANNSGDRVDLFYDNSAGTLGIENVNRGVNFLWTYDSNWHHLVAVYPSGETQTDKWLLYLDGVQKSTSSNGTVTTLSTTASNAVIGKLNVAGGYEFGGILDDVRIYNRALQSSEVSQLYNWAPGPVMHLAMNEKVSGNSKTLYDDSGNTNNGTTYYGGNATGMDCRVSGKYGSGCQFDGTDDYVDAGTAPSLQITGAITVEAWVKPNTLSGYHRIIDKFPGSYHGWSFYQSSQSFGFQLYTTELTEYYPSGSPMTTAGNWYHVAATYDGSYMRTYANGVLVGTPQAKTGLIYNDGTTNIDIGRNFGGSQYFGGSIDDVRIYNYARTSKQIVEDMNAGHPIGGSPVGSEAGYWKLDEGYGGTANNKISGNGNGTIRNGGAWTNSGKLGKGLSLDGSNDYIEVASVTQYKYTGGDFSASIWLNPDSGESDGGLVLSKPWNGGGQYNWTLSYNSNQTLTLGLVGATSWSTATTTTVAKSAWSHVSFSIDGATKAVNIYINGVLAKSATYDISSWTPVSGDASIPLAIGTLYPYGEGWAGNTGFSFKGLIDEVKVYNSTLSADDIKLDMNQGSSLILGSTGTDASGNPSNAKDRSYCPPGDTTASCGPVAEWKLDEKTGAFAYNSAGVGYTGSITGATWTQGKIGSALNFDGIDDIIVVSSGEPDSAFTNEAWFKTSQVSRGIFSITDDAGSANDRHIYMDASGCVKSRVYSNETITSSTCGFNDNRWHHAAVSVGAGGHKLYVDGKLLASGAKTSSDFNWDTRIRIGYSIDASSGYFLGQIDQVQVYNYAKSASQIAWDYNDGKPVGWWRFDEGQGITVHDESGNGNTGTMTTMDPPNDWVAGKFNGALDFDGSNDYIDAGTINYSSYAGLTFSGWIKADSLAANSIASSWGQSGNSDFAWLLFGGWWEDNKVDFLVSSTGNSYTGVRSNTTLSNGIWYHVAATWDSTSMKIYINGKLDNSNTTSIPSSIFNNNFNTYIGCDSDSASRLRFFDGQIDDVRIFNYALTAQQVKDAMNNGAINFK